MNFAKLFSREALDTRTRSTIRLLYNGIKHIQNAPAGDARADKAACEIALLLWGLHRNGYFSAGFNTEVQDLLDLIERRLRSEAVIQGFLWKPSRVSMLCMGTALLNELGRQHTKFDTLARTAWRKLFVDSSERSPFQLLEVKWSSQILGVDIQLNTPKESFLHRKSSPLIMDSEDGYAFTHSVFYATNFGRDQLPDAIIKHDLWATIEPGIVWCLLRYDFDLLGEFLLTALYCQMPYTPLVCVALCVLFLTWDENGFVPDRVLNISELASTGWFYGIYHANIVAAFLSSELMCRKLDYDKECLPRLALSSSYEELSAKLSILLARFKFHKEKSFRCKFMSTPSVLESIVGSAVTGKLVTVINDDTLSYVYPDMLIGYGLVYQEISGIILGVRRSKQRKIISPTTACGIEWLAMAMDIQDVMAMITS
jgi:hypothetical protein